MRPRGRVSSRNGAASRADGAASGGRPLRVVDITAFYGEKAGGIRTYLDAKQAWAQQEPGIEHTLVIPGLPERSTANRVEVPSVRAVATNGYRVPLGWRELRRVLLERSPDVVIAHEPFWAARGLPRLLAGTGITTVAVHHGAVGHDARSIPGSFRFWERVLSREFHRVFRDFDAIMAAIDTVPEFGLPATIPLRFGLDPAFAPAPGGAPMREHAVVYAGRMAASKCVDDLLRAAARSAQPWPLRLIGVGPARGRLERLAHELGLGGRVSFEAFVDDREQLAEVYRRAACVVLPGRWETFGLAAYEAAASGGSVVCCTSAGAYATIDGLAQTFPPGPHGGPGSWGAARRADALLAAIERARVATPDQQRAAALAGGSSWELALRAELTRLRELVDGRAAAASIPA